MRIRSATADDLDAILAVEASAGELFREVGMGVVADDPLPTHDELLRFVDVRRAWVVEVDRGVVGFALADELAGGAYLAQLSVHPSQRGRRFGSALVDEVARWAWARGLLALFLWTFREVPWNAPYYERLGFTTIAGPGSPLSDHPDGGEHLFGAGSRVAMTRPVGERDSRPALAADERTTLEQFLDQQRGWVLAKLTQVDPSRAADRVLTGSDLTVASVVEHLAHVEDNWFGRKLLDVVHEPWASAPFDWEAPRATSPAALRTLYVSACDRSRAAAARFASLDDTAAQVSFGREPASLRFVHVHLIEVTARHAGHLDLLLDAHRHG